MGQSGSTILRSLTFVRSDTAIAKKKKEKTAKEKAAVPPGKRCAERVQLRAPLRVGRTSWDSPARLIKKKMSERLFTHFPGDTEHKRFEPFMEKKSRCSSAGKASAFIGSA